MDLSILPGAPRAVLCHVPYPVPRPALSRSVCRHVPPPDPLPGDERGFVPLLSKGTMTGKRSPPGFPTLKTMSVSTGSIAQEFE